MESAALEIAMLVSFFSLGRVYWFFHHALCFIWFTIMHCIGWSHLVCSRSDEPFGLKMPKEKYVRRDGRNQPPVEAPYVPPN